MAVRVFHTCKQAQTPFVYRATIQLIKPLKTLKFVLLMASN